jgi:protein-S-isoprenylcysteine O-methyltransferase Ste14
LWIAPLLAIIDQALAGESGVSVVAFFVIACVVLIFTNLISIVSLQKSYRCGQINNIIPIQQVPVQIIPILIYFLVFLLPIPSVTTIPLAILAVALIIYSSSLLAKRQASLEKISERLEESMPAVPEKD